MMFESMLSMKYNKDGHFFEDMLGTNQAVCAKLERFNSDRGIIECTLAKDVHGYMPVDLFEPVTTKKFSPNTGKTFYPSIASKIGSCVFARIISKSEDKNSVFSFVLSRKEIIESSYEKLKEIGVTSCQITAIVKNFLFVDCGGGVPGRIHISEAAAYTTKSLRDCDFSIGDILDCKVVDFSDAECRFSLSLKIDDISAYNECDILVCTVRDKLSSNNNYSQTDADFFVEIDKSHRTAVLHARDIDDLKYGDKVVGAVLSRSSISKIYLKLCKKL